MIVKIAILKMRLTMSMISIVWWYWMEEHVLMSLLEILLVSVNFLLDNLS